MLVFGGRGLHARPAALRPPLRVPRFLAVVSVWWSRPGGCRWAQHLWAAAERDETPPPKAGCVWDALLGATWLPRGLCGHSANSPKPHCLLGVKEEERRLASALGLGSIWEAPDADVALQQSRLLGASLGLQHRGSREGHFGARSQCRGCTFSPSVQVVPSQGGDAGLCGSVCARSSRGREAPAAAFSSPALLCLTRPRVFLPPCSPPRALLQPFGETGL